VDHETGRFVDDGQVLVLEEDCECDGIGTESPRRLVLGKADRDQFATEECP
jgi:hypothetical protein